MTPSVCIVVLNWNNAPDTLECLRSLAAVCYPAFSVLVVDNGSTDDSVSVIRAGFPDMELMETGANLGYAGGNNVGIRWALDMGAEHCCVLNNDVTVAPDALEHLLAALEQHPAAGVVTPLIAEAARPSIVWAMGATLDPRNAKVERTNAGASVETMDRLAPHMTVIAPGAAMLVHRRVFQQIGLLDERFHLYYEEADWCLRAGRAGIQILVAPKAIVWHKVSATLGASSPVTDYYMARNRLQFIVGNWSGLPRLRAFASAVLDQFAPIAAYTIKPYGGTRTPSRNARLLGLRDGILGRMGPMDDHTRRVCGWEPQ